LRDGRKKNGSSDFRVFRVKKNEQHLLRQFIVLQLLYFCRYLNRREVKGGGMFSLGSPSAAFIRFSEATRKKCVSHHYILIERVLETVPGLRPFPGEPSPPPLQPALSPKPAAARAAKPPGLGLQAANHIGTDIHNRSKAPNWVRDFIPRIWWCSLADMKKSRQYRQINELCLRHLTVF
jgi:hypothetical protein